MPVKNRGFTRLPLSRFDRRLLYDTLGYQVKSVKSSEKLLWEMFVSLFVAWGFVLIQKCLNAYWLKRGGAKFKNRGYESQSELLLWFLFWRKLSGRIVYDFILDYERLRGLSLRFSDGLFPSTSFRGGTSFLWFVLRAREGYVCVYVCSPHCFFYRLLPPSKMHGHFRLTHLSDKVFYTLLNGSLSSVFDCILFGA